MANYRRGIAKFQSTLSMRRATFTDNLVPNGNFISIHALHEESDDFVEHPWDECSISIHALHEESDLNLG